MALTAKKSLAHFLYRLFFYRLWQTETLALRSVYAYLADFLPPMAD